MRTINPAFLHHPKVADISCRPESLVSVFG
jgi:hypothetical protein